MESLGQGGGGAQQLGLVAFGLSLLADVRPPGAWEARPLTEPSLPSLKIRSSVTAQAIAESWSGFEEIGWEGVIDGAPFVVERGIDGDHRFVHGTRAVHHLSADARSAAARAGSGCCRRAETAKLGSR